MDDPAGEIRVAWHAAAGGDANHVVDHVADQVVDDLLRRHAESHRRYHTAVHVMWVVRHVHDLLDDPLDDPLSGADRDDPLDDPLSPADRDDIVVAALFHDAIYDPMSPTNEHDSAALATAQLAAIGWPAERCERIATLIEATAHHQPSSLAEAVLLDADLAILGADATTYDDYIRTVREEYAAVDDDGWSAGRSRVLAGFLDRERIFATRRMFDQREVRARANLASRARQAPPRGSGRVALMTHPLLAAFDGPTADRPDALRVGDEAISWEQLRTRAESVAARIAGATAVATCATAHLDTVVAIVSGLLGGVPVVPIPPDAGPIERAHIVRDSGAVAMLGSRRGTTLRCPS